MVASERRARAALEARVGELGRRDEEKRARLGRLEGAVRRIERVRGLLGEGGGGKGEDDGGGEGSGEDGERSSEEGEGEGEGEGREKGDGKERDKSRESSVSNRHVGEQDQEEAAGNPKEEG